MVMNLSCWVVSGFANFLNNYATFFFKFLRRQSGVKKHVSLDVHPLLNIFLRHQDHEVGVIRPCVSIIITAIIIHFVIKLLLSTGFCTVKEQMFKEMCRTVCRSVLVAAACFYDCKCRNHGTGMIFYENHLHTVIKIEDRSILSLSKQRQSLIF